MKTTTKRMYPEAFDHYTELLQLIKKAIDNNEPLPFDTLYISEDGGRRSAKTSSTLRFAILAMIMFPNNVDTTGYRWQKGEDAKEFFEEWFANVEDILGRSLKKHEVNLSNNYIKLFGNKLKIKGIHAPAKRRVVKKAGLKREKGKFLHIIVKEERYEFTEDEVIAIDHALGGYKHVIKIDISNPHTLANEYTNSLDKAFKHDEKELSTKGEQFYFKKTNRFWRMIHYTNWRVNQEFLSRADIDSILETWTKSPAKAKVADWGIPGVEEGTIYEEEIPKIIIKPEKELPKNFRKLYGGIDLGEGSGENSSATAAYLIGKGYNQEWIHYKEYYHHNKTKYKSPTEKAYDIVEMFVNAAKQTEYRVITEGIDIFVEWDVAFIELLNQAKHYYRATFLHFHKTYKHPELQRINARKHSINSGKYYVASECVWHLRELEVQQWDPTKKDPRTSRALPLDADNHTTDADDYANCQDMYNDLTDETYNLMYDKNFKIPKKDSIITNKSEIDALMDDLD